MKVVIQIPCLNEEKTLPLVLKSIPQRIPGVDEIEVLVINDGSTDKTVDVARRYGVTEFVNHTRNRGLGRSFQHGVERALELGADIVVNTDGDNQYPQHKITELVQPILAGTADIVIADRQTHKIDHFSPFKKWLQRVGTSVVNYAAGTSLPDAPSGFRAYSRAALLEINTVTSFSYTLETIIQAGYKRLAITSIPIDTNPKLRESHLFRSSRVHVTKSAVAIIRAYIMYKPYVIFGTLGITLLAIGLVPFGRYFYLQAVDHTGRGHLQSLLLGLILLTAAFLCFVLNVIADLIRINRTLIEQELLHTKKIRFQRK